MFAVVEVTCILNVAAGPGHDALMVRKIEQLFAALGTSARVLTATGGGDIRDLARHAAALGGPIVAAGGDGTINAVAATLVGTGTVLGILPLGTFNHFAKDLGIPLDLSGAVRTVLAGGVRAVDVGEVNGQVFLNNSSLGFYPRMVRLRVTEQRRGHARFVSLALAALTCLRHPSSLLIRLRVDGVEVRVKRTALLFVGNNRYTIAGSRIGGRVRIDSGRLWLCATPDVSCRRLAGLMMRALAGRLHPSDLEAEDACEILVETRRRKLNVAWDGEVTSMTTPLRYTIHPGALRVLVPE